MSFSLNSISSKQTNHENYFFSFVKKKKKRYYKKKNCCSIMQKVSICIPYTSTLRNNFSQIVTYSKHHKLTIMRKNNSTKVHFIRFLITVLVFPHFLFFF